MRNNTIGNINSKPNNYFTSTIIQKKPKINFPSLSPHQKTLNSLNFRKINSISKKRVNTERKVNETFTGNLRVNPKIKMVKMLNFEEQVDTILNTDISLEKAKEKIDKNKTIKLMRLGLFKKKDKENENETNNEIETIVEKEKENEEDLEKMDIENREKERKWEKKLKENLSAIEKLRQECEKLNSEINDLNDVIGDYKMESNVLTNYAEEFDKKYQEKLNNDAINKEKDKDNESIIDDSPRKRGKSQHLNLFQNMSKMIIIKQQREDKKKIIQEKIMEKETLKQKLENELITKRALCNKAKKNLYEVRKNLINSYHLKLYQGLEFKGEGLSTLIKEIWNLGVNVNIEFMPTYLDWPAIEFLFKKARQSIELNNLRQIIKENEVELSYYLKEWKKNDKEINKMLLNKNRFSINNNINNNENDDNKNNLESEFFKTKISDISISYLDPYPKTKQFMINYKKKHPNLFNRDLPSSHFKNIPFKSLNIPLTISEKSKHIEKLKYLLEIKIEQNKRKDKNEVERIQKEFIKNNYKEKYQVNVETVFGALFGEEKKNEMLIYYTKLEKEYRDGKKIIQFHTKLNIKLK